VSSSRKIYTQLTILKRIIIVFGVFLTFIAITMLFDSVKGLSTSLLTTAGIISAIGAFASQQSLGRLFAGLQLAFTQPMRIGDTVIIDNEFGQVEEITLFFITIKLWDLRRLILPTDYFTNKGLLNLTRESSELLGTIFLYTDYTLPVDLIRKKFTELLKASAYWNKKVGALEVTDIKQSTLEIRCLVSANDSSNLWKLRCELREKLIKYVVDHHHNCLAKTRSLSLNNFDTDINPTVSA
jgi:small-conductance mechanosensitive channel